MANTKHIGLIGCGNWGKYILRDLKKLGCKVSVIAPSEKNREQALQLGADAASAELSVLKTVDGVVIATPTVTHLTVIREVAKWTDVPIFVEKPLSNDFNAANALVKDMGERVFVMDKWRYHPGILALAKIAREKTLGPVLGLRTYRLGWGNPHEDVDGIWILAPHDLSIILEILGFIPSPCAATVTAWQDQATGLTAILGSQPWATLEVSVRHYPTRREIRLECLDGVAVLSDGYAEHITIYRKDDSWQINVEPKVEHIKIDDELPLYSELKSFLSYLNGGPAPKSHAQEALAMVQTIAILREMAGLPHLTSSGVSMMKEDCHGIS